jgi:ABC-2 type transport system ATP-binding protein
VVANAQTDSVNRGHGGGHGTPHNPSDTPAIRVEGLRKQFGAVEAVRGVSFTVAPGEMFAFLGPNGAGKTTTINMLCTLTAPTAGRAWIGGYDIVSQQALVRQHIGLVFQESTLDEYLTAEENLRFHAELYGIPRAQVSDRLRQVLEMVGLWERRSHQVRTFSGGMKRRLEIARGLLHSPRVLFLDEPTVGLDPQTRAHIWSYINELRRRESITMFLTSHYMDEAENCDRVAIMDEGRIVALDTLVALKASVGQDRIEIRTDDDEAAIAALQERFSLTATKAEGAVRVYVPGGEEFVPRLFAELGVPIRAVNVARPTLDDVFMSYTGRTIRDAEASTSDKAAGNPWRRRAMARGRR